MTVRKTLEQANAEKGHFDAEKFDSLADADIEGMIADDPDLAPPTERLAPSLDVRVIRGKLGFTRRQLAGKLDIPLATLRDWEHGRGQTDPAVHALLRILDKIPEPALRALDDPARKPD
jgi:putative transcriptional regulator